MSNYSSISASDAFKDIESGNEVSLRTISEPLDARGQTFRERVRFLNCDFVEKVDFSHCRFEKGLEFVGCVFEKEVSFEAAWVNVDCGFRACWFKAGARFDRLVVKGKLDVRAPRSKLELKNNLNTELPGPYVTFEDNASFSQMHVAGEANFGSVQFKGEADFYNARIEGPAFFRLDYCKGYQETPDGSEWFEDAEFITARFKERARFRDAYIGSELNCHGAKFEANTDFSYIRVRGVTFFCDPDGKKNIPCEFKGELNFEGARFSASVKFVKAEFCGKVNFLDCVIAETLLFAGKIPTTLILKGCRYKRIKCCHKQLMDVLERKAEVGARGSAQPAPPRTLRKWWRWCRRRSRKEDRFDRSSWIQLETALRRDGYSKRADETYLERMRQERELTLRGYRWFLSWMWEHVSKYGTSQWQLAILCVFVLVAGMLFYRYFGDLEPTRDAVQSVSCKKTYGTAFGVSLFQFVPVSLPVGDQCKPSGGVEWFAFFQRMFGWVLVPLLAANLAGMLQRKADSSPRAESIED
jgi:hypothetical protein